MELLNETACMVQNMETFKIHRWPYGMGELYDYLLLFVLEPCYNVTATQCQNRYPKYA